MSFSVRLLIPTLVGLIALVNSCLARGTGCFLGCCIYRTLAEEIEYSEVIALAKWTRIVKRGTEEFGEFKIEQVHKGKSLTKPGEVIEVSGYSLKKEGKHYLVTGFENKGKLKWSLRELTIAAYQYTIKIPPAKPRLSRLQYWARHLENSDESIAEDAYESLDKLTIKEWQQLKGSLDKNKLQKWALDPKVEGNRRSLYGVFLGLCGDKQTAELLRKYVIQTPQVFRDEAHGLMTGFLMLTGEEGLKILEEEKLKKKILEEGKLKKMFAFSETYAAMMAIRFMWKYEHSKLSKTRLRDSLRLLLDRPQLADLVIADLARMHDWEAMPRILAIYDNPDFGESHTKRAVIRYLTVCGGIAKTIHFKSVDPATAKKARQHFEEIKERDPDTVKDAMKFVRLLNELNQEGC